MAKTGPALLRIAPFVIGALAIAILLLVARSFLGSGGFAYDYQAYDAAARRIATGQPLYPPGVAEAYNSGAYANLYLYPPPLAVLLLPITLLTSNTAALLWLGLRLALLVGGTLLLPIPGLAKAGLLAVAAISFPVWYDLNLGNLSVVLFALSCVVWRYRDTEVGGFALAIAGALRYPFGLVVMPLALRRRWRALAATITGAVAIALASLPFVGVGGWLDYLRTLSSLRDVSSGEHNLSFATTAQALGIGGPDGMWVALGIGAALLLALYASLRRDTETAAVVALAATILFFPFFHPHYLVQLLIPAAFLAGRGQWWGLALPLLGWLPGQLMAPAALLGAALPLLPPRFLALRPVGERLGGAVEFETGPARP